MLDSLKAIPGFKGLAGMTGLKGFSGLLRDPRRNFLRESWLRLARVPKGNILYSRIVGRLVPYSGTIPFTVTSLADGNSTVDMPDTPRVRNHLNSIHAIALANLGELSTGLALNFALPPKARCILTRYQVDYVKKARGKITARTEFAVPEWGPHQEVVVRGTLVDSKGDEVARVAATWLVDAL